MERRKDIGYAPCRMDFENLVKLTPPFPTPFDSSSKNYLIHWPTMTIVKIVIRTSETRQFMELHIVEQRGAFTGSSGRHAEAERRVGLV